MIWRSTTVFLASLTAATLSVVDLQAQSMPLLLAQSSVVDPDAAIDTGQATPDFSSTTSNSPANGTAVSEEQIREIKTLQQELKNRGYYDGPVDGIYGPKTEAAIRELRGQDAGQADEVPSTLFPANTATADTPAAAPENEAQGGDESEADDNSVRINAENVAEDGEEINIGDDVSPATENGEPAPEVPSEASDVEAATQPESPGLGRLLWPGLALIVTFGSIGLGFLLTNRGKSGEDETDSPWGAVPDPLPQQPEPPSSLNGHTVTSNGTGSMPKPESMTHQPRAAGDGLPLVSAADQVTPTTRLAKVDVIDELVSNLQVTDPSKRRKAIWELGQRGNSSAVQPLVNSMVDADSKEKSLILAALSEIGIRSLKPMNRALAIALQDDNPDVRKNAIRDLTRVYDLVTQISQMLGHATEDTDPEVRRTAEWALEQLNRIREAPKLKSSLNTLEAARSTPELLPDEVENLKN